MRLEVLKRDFTAWDLFLGWLRMRDCVLDLRHSESGDEYRYSRGSLECCLPILE